MLMSEGRVPTPPGADLLPEIDKRIKDFELEHPELAFSHRR
jgi:hypothetical protein